MVRIINKVISLLHRLAIILLVVSFVLPVNAQAQQISKKQADKQSFKSDNALIHANILTYIPEENLVIASGDVEISQEGRILLAKELRYNKLTDTVIAIGNVSILEPDGTVYFADRVELKDQLRQGVIENFSARFTDNSLIASNQAIRIDENKIELKKAVYSPCKVCEGYAGSTPLWQIRASEVEVDNEEQQVTYHHAFFEFYGIPVLYTPYLSHATPGADKKSGFLIPSYSSNDTLGTIVKTPYFWNIAPNMDATITPRYTSIEGIIFEGEFRHLTQTGKYLLYGSMTNPDQRDGAGDKTSGNEFRSHIEGSGLFNINDTLSWGFAGKRVSDDTYLQRYGFGTEDLLTSRLYAQDIDGHNYIGAEAISFQGLNSEDDPGASPFIMPLANAHFQTRPGWRGSWFNIDSNMLVLSRSEGIESRRLSSTVGWQLPHITSGGHIFYLKTRMRGDVYDVENVPDPLNSSKAQEGFVGRAIPEVEIDWSLPLARQGSHSTMFFEPIAQIIVSPHGNNPSKIPNEDSQEIEISDMNLFSSNHFAGLDLVEGGPRANYGFRGLLSFPDITDINFLFGQNYRTKREAKFTPESGLDKNFSDYVGRLGFTIFENLFDINYRFKLDRKEFDASRTEIDGTFTKSPVSLTMNYLSLNEGSPDNPVLEREEVTASGSIKLSKFWTLQGNTKRDLSDNGGYVNAGAGLIFDNECLIVSLLFDRDFTSDRDIEPTESFTLEIILKSLN